MTLMRGSRRSRSVLAAIGAIALGASLFSATAAMAEDDPRATLTPGRFDAGQVASNITLLQTLQQTGTFDGSFNSDLAFTGDHAIVGSYNGFQIYNIADAAAPSLRGTFVCPGGQGDVSVHGNLLFMSVEATLGRLDCGAQGASGTINPDRFRGVRIFDISNLDNPVLVKNVQTCRGSHTHTVVTDPDDATNVYVYVSGTAGVRNAAELAGCTGTPTSNTEAAHLDASGNPILSSRFLIEVIKVPVAAPQDAAIVNQARLFTSTTSGSPAGLWPGGNHGTGTQSTSATDACHDITAYPEIGLAAGACEGNGILIDIHDPANPVRVDAVTDPGFSYWHSATFNNDGTKVVFTDEWGGGSSARCRATDRTDWGANAIFDIVDGKLQFASYYKLPVVQTTTENCVAHNGSLIPVPGRDIMVQAWYQGGLSVFDFTDSKNPVEIAYFDRGPISATSLTVGGYWSTYWYNGNVLGSEISRGFDSLELNPSAKLSANEIAAAREYELPELNVQMQRKIQHTPSFAVTRAYIDQAERDGSLSGEALVEVREHVDTAEHLVTTGANKRALVAQLTNAARKTGLPDSAVVQALSELAATFS